jgi:hypothetical protein
MATQRFLIKKENKRRPKIDPCGTSLIIGKYSDRIPPAQTHWKRPERKDSMKDTIEPEKPYIRCNFRQLDHSA